MQLQHKANTMTILQGERDASRRTYRNIEQRRTRSLRPCDIYLEGPLDCRVGGIAEVRAMVSERGGERRWETRVSEPEEKDRSWGTRCWRREGSPGTWFSGPQLLGRAQTTAGSAGNDRSLWPGRFVGFLVVRTRIVLSLLLKRLAVADGERVV